MPAAQPHPPTRIASAPCPARVGCVSYLNAKPLVEALADDHPGVTITYDVPSRLRAMLDAGTVDMALCPVIDYHTGSKPLAIIPVGGIGCCGPTLTVRLFSQIPFNSITRVAVDPDSHTSVALLRIILHHQYGVTPPFEPWHRTSQHNDQHPESLLLIGDKVVTHSPPEKRYPHQLDLGEAWHRLTGLPFVFAVWMSRAEAPLGSLPAQLNNQRLKNAAQLDVIAQRYAPQHGWPAQLACEYLGRYLQYEIDQPQLEAIQRFHNMAQELGLIPHPQPIRIGQPVTSFKTPTRPSPALQ